MPIKFLPIKFEVMKKIFAALLWGGICSLLLSCNKEEVAVSPVINAVSPEVFSSDAGLGEIRYEIANPSEGVSISAYCSSTWLSDIDVSVPGIVSFSISENTDAESREAIVRLSYPQAASVDVKVIQAGAEDTSEVPDFTITVTDVTAFSAQVTVEPADEDMTYLLLTGTKADIESYASDEDLIAYNLSIFTEVAAQQGFSLEYILDNVLLRKGRVTAGMNTFVPDTDYYVYVYGIGKDAVVTTPVYKEPVRTAPVTVYDEKIDISFPEIGTRSITSSFVPESDSFRYLYGYMTEGEFNAYGESEFVSAMILEMQYVLNMYASMGIDVSWEDVSSVGEQKLSAAGLYSGSGYEFYAFGVDHGYSNTSLFHETAETDAVMVTDGCKFEVSLMSVGTYDAEISVTPSSSDTRYHVSLLETSQIAGLQSSVVADACINELNQGGSGWTASLRSGVAVLQFGDLEPSASYTVVVFGADSNGERTTEVFLHEFRTGEVPASDMTFDVSVTDVSYASVTVNILPSVKDEPYVTGLLTEEQYAVLGKSPEAIAARVCRDYANLGLSQNMGNASLSISRDYEYNFVTPGTTYHVFVFGCSHWYQTTPVTVVECRVPERVVSDASVDIKVTVYDANDLIAADPVSYPESQWKDRAAVQVEFFPNSYASSWYGWIEERSAEYMQQLNMDVLLAAIKMNGQQFKGTSSGRAVVGLPWNYQNCSAIALGVDSGGVDGEPVIVSLYADRSQIEEYDPAAAAKGEDVRIPLYPAIIPEPQIPEGNAEINAYVPKQYVLSETALDKALAQTAAGDRSCSPEIRPLRQIASDCIMRSLSDAGYAVDIPSESPVVEFSRITGMYVPLK